MSVVEICNNWAIKYKNFTHYVLQIKPNLKYNLIWVHFPDVPIEDEGEDDDVILNEVAPIRIVVDDDDDEEPLETNQLQESVIVKQEKKPIYDDGFIDVEEIVTLKDVGQVKIKSEPVDEGKFFYRFHCFE